VDWSVPRNPNWAQRGYGLMPEFGLDWNGRGRVVEKRVDHGDMSTQSRNVRFSLGGSRGVIFWAFR
jgi:hypothetical protein